jgi:hypothetical protein
MLSGPSIHILRIERDVGSSLGGRGAVAPFANLARSARNTQLLMFVPAVIEPRTRHGHNRPRMFERDGAQHRNDLGREGETPNADHEHGLHLGRI